MKLLREYTDKSKLASELFAHSMVSLEVKKRGLPVYRVALNEDSGRTLVYSFQYDVFKEVKKSSTEVPPIIDSTRMVHLTAGERLTDDEKMNTLKSHLNGLWDSVSNKQGYAMFSIPNTNSIVFFFAKLSKNSQQNFGL